MINEQTEIILSKLDDLQKTIIEKSKPFLSMEETSKYLGISKSTCYIYSSKRILPHYKLQNRKLYFKIDELNEFILNEKNRIKSFKELEEEAITKVATSKRAGRR